MASTFAVSPAALHDTDNHLLPHQNLQPSLDTSEQHISTTSTSPTHMSTALSQIHSDTLSPNFTNDTPGGSNYSTLSHYQSSDLSDLEEDPFFGADFNNAESGAPSFLDDNAAGLDRPVFSSTSFASNRSRSEHQSSHYPMTPEQTISVQTASPLSDHKLTPSRSVANQLPNSISLQELQKPFRPAPLMTGNFQHTPSQSSSGRSSEESVPLGSSAVPCSPRVTVSMWGKDNDQSIHTVERTFDDSPKTVRSGLEAAGDLISSSNDALPTPAPRDPSGKWQRNPATGHSGLEPGRRPSDEISSLNEVMARHEITERKNEVGKWITDQLDDASLPTNAPPEDIQDAERSRETSTDDIPLGDQTENKYLPGQTYFTENDGGMSQRDYEIIAKGRNWEDAPMFHPIHRGEPGRNQPPTSQAAIERFEKQCRDNDSVLSRAATWGTRRRSLHSIKDVDAEVMKSGNILKKLAISRDKGSLLKDLRGLVRRPSASQLLKRTRSGNDEDSFTGSDSRGSQDTKRDIAPHLAPPTRASSWGKKPTPSINTALVSMGSNFASIGTTHARSGSISNSSITSPKSPFGGLSVRNTLIRRPRSKSDLSKPSPTAANAESHPNLISMWKQSGGPPVASLAKTTTVDYDDEEDEDEDAYDDGDMRPNASLIHEIEPTYAGFQKHILTLNPDLTAGHYLAERIAHQQTIRYKQLLSSKLKHLTLGQSCPSGSLCIALGGASNILDPKGDARELDPLANHHKDEEASTSGEGVIIESFPQDIPMPPTHHLPAEFECQLCFQHKKFQKPSDWTKHVHEDVQPFTCTWDKCREPKIFKRKADWVRHENEGHRHLEWWTCNVDDCRHTCYRRDNFLQHLVREHKFPEPKVKTKAAIKRTGGQDPTWRKVETCHVETTARPLDETCRFCGKCFPTWKKLTVHLAKHMEQISLPVLRLVALKSKDLTPDSIISPVHDAPVRPTFPAVNQSTASMHNSHGLASNQYMHSTARMEYQSHEQFLYSGMQSAQFQQANYYNPPYDGMNQNLQSSPLGSSFNHSQPMQELPVSTSTYVSAPQSYMTMPNSGMEPFQQMNANALGLQGQGQGPVVGQPTYNGNRSPFSGQGSASPYARSPHVNAGNTESMWDGRPVTGFY